jgi:DNA-binding transcriptional MerR regulator
VVFSAAASSAKQFCDSGCPDNTGWAILVGSFVLCAVLLAIRLRRLILALDGNAARDGALVYAFVFILASFDGDLIVFLPWRDTATTRAFAGFPDDTSIAFTAWGIMLRKAPFLLFTTTMAPSSSSSSNLSGTIFWVTVGFSGLSLALSLAARGMRYLGKTLEGVGDVVLGRAADFVPGGFERTESDAITQPSSDAGCSLPDLGTPFLAQHNGSDGVQASGWGGGYSGGAIGGGSSRRAPPVASLGGTSGAQSAIQVLLGVGLAVIVVTKNVPSTKQVEEVAEPLLIALGVLLAVAIFFFASRLAWASCFGRKFERLSTIISKDETLEEQRQALAEQQQSIEEHQQALAEQQKSLEEKEQALEENLQAFEANHRFIEVVQEVTREFGIDIEGLRSFEEIKLLYSAASLRYFGDDATGVAPDTSDEAASDLQLRERLFNAHPERAHEERARLAAWRDEHLPRCLIALTVMRTIVPPGARGVTVETLVKKGLPLEVARRVARNPALGLIGTHPDDIARMALSDLQQATTQGLDVIELRAVFAALPAQMANDDSKGSKATWVKEVQAGLQKLTKLEEACSLSPGRMRHRCYEVLAGGQGPLDPEAPLEKVEVVSSSAFEPTALEEMESGGGGGGGGAATGRVAMARAALLKAQNHRGETQVALENPSAGPGGGGKSSAKLAALRARQQEQGGAEEKESAGAQLFASLKNAVGNKDQRPESTSV